MSVEQETKNSSLSLLDRKEVTNSIGVPIRNAFSSAKRSKDNLRANFKAVRLKDLTQEMLEAADEPLGRIAEQDGEESVEQEHLNIKKPTESILDLPVKKERSPNNPEDLGVSWLETPAKSKPNLKCSDNFCVKMPKTANNKLLITPLNCRKKEFVASTSILRNRKHNFESVQKTEHSINIKPFVKTPLSKFVTSSSEYTPQNPKQKQVKSIGTVMSVDRYNKIACTKSSIKSTNSTSVQQRNKENANGKTAKPKVQFSMPIMECNDPFEIIKIKDVNYIVLNQVGQGGSSVVYHCYDFEAKSERAIKKVNLKGDANAAGYINEVKLLDKLQKCNRIIKMFDYEIIESQQVLYVILEKGGSDLSRILKDLACTNKHLPMYMLIFYWMEMLYAVQQIHENGIIHSDLKPANFLRVEDGLKLIDFGIASCIQNDMTSVVRNIPIGSFNYISPEALTNQSSDNCDSPSFGKPRYKVSYKSDVWSLGCILYQLVYRKTPFQHIGHMWAKISAITDPEHKINYPEVDWVPFKIINTIKSCLQYNMKARPSIDDLIQEYEGIYT